MASSDKSLVGDSALEDTILVPATECPAERDQISESPVEELEYDKTMVSPRQSPKPLEKTESLLSGPGFVYLSLAVVVISVIALFLCLPPPGRCGQPLYVYNNTPLGKPDHRSNGELWLNIVVVTDLDHDSKVGPSHWQSHMKRGILTLSNDRLRAYVHWNPTYDVVLTQDFASKDRSMELSDLVVFDGYLLSVDDRTGIIYRIGDHNQMIPWVLLNDGPGNTTKGFKAEWLTVKDERLYVGGIGKEWTTSTGVFQSRNPMWVKIVEPNGAVQHVDWTENYKALRAPLGIDFPGYMIHESAQWSHINKKWFFLPRRVSTDVYDENLDEERGTNLIITASESFSHIQYLNIGISTPTRGFSAFQFVPDTNDDIVIALKSEERKGKSVASYITVFRISDGHILLPETALGTPHKFEGIAFS